MEGIRAIAHTILKRVGHSEFYEGADYYGGDDYTAFEYTYDKLKISSPSSKDMKINYNNRTVFDYRNNIYNKGPWEELLFAIYNNLDALETEKNIDELKTKLGNEFMDKIYYEFPYAEVTYTKNFRSTGSVRKNLPGINLYLVSKIEEYEMNSDYAPLTHYTYEIYKTTDNTCLFSATREGYKTKYRIDKYVFGDWQDELLGYFKIQKMLKEMEKSREDEKSVEESINKLLKKSIY